MHPRIVRVFRFLPAGLLLGLGTLVSAAARAETIEVEPNHPCALAQSLGNAAAAPSVRGQRDAGDVDYYRLTVPAGALLTIDLLGAGAGDGTLYDGYLGVFAGDCQGLLATDDESGAWSDARVRMLVPAAGSVVIAATAWPDYGFTGNGSGTGTYRLRVSLDSVTGTLSGRLVDAETGDPIPNAYLYLYRCEQGECSTYVNSGYPDADGRFAFHSDFYSLLTSGQYLLSVDAYSYEPAVIGPFEVNGKVDVDLGDLAISPLPTVGSVRGRLVDEATGQPLRGNTSPYAYAELRFCGSGASYCYYQTSLYAEADGSFEFRGTPGYPLQPGKYLVRTGAEQYVQTESDMFTLGEDEDIDLGDVPVRSLPVRVEPLEVCTNVPSSGGRCRFTVKVTNGQPSTLRAQAWTLVTGSSLGPPVWSSAFQLPQKSLSLLPGGSTVLQFNLDVPGAVSGGAYVCTRLYASAEGQPLVPLAGRDLFCLFKGYAGFQRVPEPEVRRLRTSGVLPEGLTAAPAPPQPPIRRR